MIKYADIYDKNILGGLGINGNFGLIQDRYYLKALYGWTDTQKFDFFNHFYQNILNETVPMPNACHVINKLKKLGHTIYFITARLTQIKDCDTEALTKDMLFQFSIPYDKLLVNASDKLTVCKENQIEFFIDDSYDTCKQLSENGIPSLLMTTKMNEKIVSSPISRVNNWNEIETFLLTYILKK